MKQGNLIQNGRLEWLQFLENMLLLRLCLFFLINKLSFNSKMNLLDLQKQPLRVVLKKSCSENVQQIYRRTPMMRWASLFEITLRHGCSPVNVLHIFRTPLPRNTSGWLFLGLLSSILTSLPNYLMITKKVILFLVKHLAEATIQRCS